MNKSKTTISEVARVTAQLIVWRNTLSQMRAEFMATENDSCLEGAGELANKIALAEKWLAEDRVVNSEIR